MRSEIAEKFKTKKCSNLLSGKITLETWKIYSTNSYSTETNFENMDDGL